MGLNILLGFAGQISLGTGRVHAAVGAYACYKLTTWFPDGMNVIIAIMFCQDRALWQRSSASIFGLPSLRIKGFYLVPWQRWAAQFFILEWAVRQASAWLYNYNDVGRHRPFRRANADGDRDYRTPGRTWSKHDTSSFCLTFLDGFMTWIASRT